MLKIKSKKEILFWVIISYILLSLLHGWWAYHYVIIPPKSSSAISQAYTIVWPAIGPLGMEPTKIILEFFTENPPAYIVIPMAITINFVVLIGVALTINHIISKYTQKTNKKNMVV